MVSPATRGYISNKVNAVTGAVGTALSLGGKTLWVISSSALLIGVPWALAWGEEQQVLEMEKEMKMREMGTASGVPIEPPKQTALLDACLDVAGVVAGGVPGGAYLSPSTIPS